MKETVSLEVAIEVVLRNGPNFELIAGLCKMEAEAEREACAELCERMARRTQDIRSAALEMAAENIRARGGA